MEDQGKRLLLAVAITFGIMMVWSWLFPAPPPLAPPAEVTPAEVAREPGPAGGAPESSAPARPAVARGPEQRLVFDGDAFDRFHAEVTSYGGTISSWQLQRRKYATDGALLDLVLAQAASDDALRPLQVSFPESTYALPDDSAWTLQRTSPTEATLTTRTSELEVVKRLRFLPEDYLLELKLEVRVVSPGAAVQRLALATFAYEDPELSGSGFGGSVDLNWHPACVVGDESLDNLSFEDLAGNPVVQTGAVRWAGFNHSYFLSALAPRNEQGERLRCSASAVAGQPGVMRMTLEYPQATLSPGSPAYERTVFVYLGPKYLHDLERAAGLVGFDPRLDAAVNLGWFAVICRPLLWLLKAFHSIVGNWGIAIILLTVVVQLLTLYWTTKSMRSMQAMARLRPEIEKLQKKYKDDRQRQQVEMMALYKAHQVNPLAGCLPMLLQMPIWFALYRTLSVAAELYHSPFIPGWLGDLTSPDPYYIMPVLLTGTMFLQTRLQPSPVESAQQKIMMYGMPLMFGGFSLFFPSGLTLYIFTNTVLRSAHQLYLNRSGARSGPAAAVAVSDGDDAASPDAVAGEAPAGGALRPVQSKSKKGVGSRKRKKPGSRR